MAINEAVEDNTANITTLVPNMAAFLPSNPSSFLLYILSITTIASSITRPTATAIAIREIVFKENPNIYIRKTVPRIDTGIAIKGMKVILKLPKNKKIVIAVSSEPNTIS